MKSQRTNVGVIGHAALGKSFYDGQTVSTRLWVDELKKQPQIKKVFLVDTYNYKKRPVSILFSYFRCALFCSDIIVMLSGNGLKFFLPLLYWTKKLFGKRFYNRCIGGNMDEFVIKHPEQKKYVQSLEVNWVQSDILKNRLCELGVTNVAYLENFRNIQPIARGSKQTAWSSPFAFCTFCRVAKAKGISDAILAIAAVNREAGFQKAVLHIYGPVEDDYRAEFESLLSEHRDCVEYKGAVESSDAVSVLKDYYFHLFPSTWRGEGFPGTLLDCYNAGLPTVATDWAFNAEFIKTGETGFVYPWQEKEKLFEMIQKAMALSPAEYEVMVDNNLNLASRFTGEKVMKKILSGMGIVD